MFNWGWKCFKLLLGYKTFSELSTLERWCISWSPKNYIFLIKFLSCFKCPKLEKVLVSNDIMSAIWKSNKCKTCQQKITNPLTIERHVLMGSYFWTHVFHLLDFDMDDIISFDTKYFFQKLRKMFPFFLLFFAKTNGIYIRYIFLVKYVYACTIINQDFPPPLIYIYIYIYTHTLIGKV